MSEACDGRIIINRKKYWCEKMKGHEGRHLIATFLFQITWEEGF